VLADQIDSIMIVASEWSSHAEHIHPGSV
jgi:hypothetical protein